MNSGIDWTQAGTALGAFVAYTGVVAWLWQVRGIAVNARDSLAEHKMEHAEFVKETAARLRAAEETAGAVRELAAAVRHGAEMTGTQIKSLADRFDQHAAYTKDELTEIKAEQRSFREVMTGARPAPARRRD